MQALLPPALTPEDTAAVLEHCSVMQPSGELQMLLCRTFVQASCVHCAGIRRVCLVITLLDWLLGRQAGVFCCYALWIQFIATWLYSCIMQLRLLMVAHVCACVASVQSAPCLLCHCLVHLPIGDCAMQNPCIIFAQCMGLHVAALQYRQRQGKCKCLFYACWHMHCEHSP